MTIRFNEDLFKISQTRLVRRTLKGQGDRVDIPTSVDFFLIHMCLLNLW